MQYIIWGLASFSQHLCFGDSSTLICSINNCSSRSCTAIKDCIVWIATMSFSVLQVCFFIGYLESNMDPKFGKSICHLKLQSLAPFWSNSLSLRGEFPSGLLSFVGILTVLISGDLLENGLALPSPGVVSS